MTARKKAASCQSTSWTLCCASVMTATVLSSKLATHAVRCPSVLPGVTCGGLSSVCLRACYLQACCLQACCLQATTAPPGETPQTNLASHQCVKDVVVPSPLNTRRDVFLMSSIGICRLT